MSRAENGWLWGRALIVLVLFCLFVVAVEPAHATRFHHDHFGHRHLAWHHRVHHFRRSRRARAMSRGAYPIVNGRRDELSIAMRYLGSGNPTGSRGAWCGDFINLVERLAGRPGVRSRMAEAWASYGRASAAVPGAIAVQRGHVALVIRRIGERVQIISGNWSHRVGIGWIGLRSAAYRMP